MIYKKQKDRYHTFEKGWPEIWWEFVSGGQGKDAYLAALVTSTALHVERAVFISLTIEASFVTAFAPVTRTLSTLPIRGSPQSYKQTRSISNCDKRQRRTRFHTCIQAPIYIRTHITTTYRYTHTLANMHVHSQKSLYSRLSIYYTMLYVEVSGVMDVL